MRANGSLQLVTVSLFLDIFIVLSPSVVAAGLPSSPDWVAEGNQSSSEFGRSVSTAGDVDADGFSDVIVGAFRFDNGQSNEGRAFTYHGSPTGVLENPTWVAESDQGGSRFGFSVADAGDVNGDGFGDVIVGADAFDNGQSDEGRVLVYLGSSSGLSTTPVWTAEPDVAFAHFGFSVARAGDVNGDGFDDVVVGANEFTGGQTDEGRAFVYLGSASGLSSTPAWVVESDQAFARFGESVASAGDVNGDGYDDVIVGADGFDNDQVNEGRAFVFMGSASGLSLSPAWVVESDQQSSEFGSAVSSAGDVNNDGFSDVIVGAWAFGDGRAFVYLGSAAGLSTVPTWTGVGTENDAEFGFSVSAAGDIDRNGFDDVIVGAYAFDGGQSYEGQASVFVGSGSGPSNPELWSVEGNQSNAAMGGSVSTAGDVNNDGVGDVIVGISRYENGESQEGGAFVYHGAADAPVSVGGPDRAASSSEVRLEGAQPNPFQGSTSIRYVVPAPGEHARLSIYSADGRLVRQLSDRFESPGRNQVSWDGRDTSGRAVASGVYLLRYSSEVRTVLKRINVQR